MNIDSRLNKLETHAATLPPDGAALIRQGERLPAEERGRWLDGRTEQELEAIRLADGGAPVDWERLTVAELEQIARDGIWPIRRVQL